jgi:hypothetical protein
MELKSLINRSKVSLNLYVASGFTGLILTIFFEIFYLKRKVFLEGTPNLNATSILCSLAIFISTILIFGGLTNASKSLYLSSNDEPNNTINFSNCLVIGIVISATIFLALFIVSPYTFSELTKEDKFIEIASAMILLASCLTTLVCWIKCQYSLYVPKITKAALIFLAITFFLIAMEEISWFQRIINFQTPELLSKANEQNEFNLHNLATNKVENIYYFASFILLVILPFLRYLFSSITVNNFFNLLIPQSQVIIPGAIASAYNYNMWDNPLMKITFFTSVVVLFLFSFLSNKKPEKFTAAFTLFLIVITQVIFLVNGNNFQRNWDVTEYKELFIPLGFFVYSLLIFSRAAQLYPSRQAN